jgi:hypothetical protein
LNLIGGTCRFAHCTIVNYYPYNPELGWANSDNETLILTDYLLDETGKSINYPLTKAEFFNSIIWGGRYFSTSAIRIELDSGGDAIPYFFQNCLLPNKGSNDDHFVDCLFQVGADSLFQKTNPNDFEKNSWYPSFDFRLKKNSPAKDVANLEIATQIPYDLNGFYRLTDGLPDLGAYEYFEDSSINPLSKRDF